MYYSLLYIIIRIRILQSQKIEFFKINSGSNSSYVILWIRYIQSTVDWLQSSE